MKSFTKLLLIIQIKSQNKVVLSETDMAVDKVEPPQVAVLPLAKGVVHHGETSQHLNFFSSPKISSISFTFT